MVEIAGNVLNMQYRHLICGRCNGHIHHIGGVQGFQNAAIPCHRRQRAGLDLYHTAIGIIIGQSGLQLIVIRLWLKSKLNVHNGHLHIHQNIGSGGVGVPCVVDASSKYIAAVIGNNFNGLGSGINTIHIHPKPVGILRHNSLRHTAASGGGKQVACPSPGNGIGKPGTIISRTVGTVINYS